jgi:hypothetical protein
MNGHEAAVKLLVDWDDVEAGPPTIKLDTSHQLDYAPQTRPRAINSTQPT